ncbi:hypothetical protein M409DRAFT_56101 [Zasmidium cellare ATCC 36951]|uniref:Uncharacterized protein n=1 Tax=Zasmidium cellare ATCC 36951 TaxID=1080233 RepID=A0A6A6CDD5_ZASCE|nr:uncharacterized protein M409DRAFT_56101 [Zasmidium cellare ATCC 36951]KAF2165227.1 hypothetical protein M409DRAFT_56101 [Zasmidium cellare ATCC 36951]
MADDGGMDDASNDSMTKPASDVLIGIKDTSFGYDVLARVPAHLFGTQAEKLFQSFEDFEVEDKEGVWHEDRSCACFWNYTPYIGCREEPCTCKASFWATYDEQLLSALLPDKVAVFAALIEFESRVVGYETSPVSDFLDFAQKLDNLALAVCRSLLKAAKTDSQIASQVLQAFNMLQKARNVLPAPYQDDRQVYFYHSMAVMKRWHTEEISYLVFKIIGGQGLPDELVERIRELFIESRDEDLSQCESQYYKTYKDCCSIRYATAHSSLHTVLCSVHLIVIVFKFTWTHLRTYNSNSLMLSIISAIHLSENSHLQLPIDSTRRAKSRSGVMADSGAVVSSSSLTHLDVLVLIKKTWLGSELICSTPRGTTEHIFGDEGALVLDDVEDYSEGEGTWHEQGCPCAKTNGIYNFCRDRPCLCEVPSADEVEVVAALRSEKPLEVIKALVCFGEHVLESLLHDKSLGWEMSIWYFLMFTQKLDDTVLAICRDIIKTGATREIIDAFNTLQNARRALKAPHKDSRHVYLYHSMACLTKPYVEDMSYLVYKILEGRGLSDELIEMVREFYIEVSVEEVDLDQRDGQYYKTYKNRWDLGERR